MARVSAVREAIFKAWELGFSKLILQVATKELKSIWHKGNWYHW
jgi:hypothetical protein